MIMRRLLLLIAVLGTVTIQAKQWSTGEDNGNLQSPQVSLTFQNESDRQRQEVAEVGLQAVCGQLGISSDEPLLIRNKAGQEVAYQKTYDGKLLIFVSLHPHGKASYTLSKGQPSEPKVYVGGKVYPIRKDDLAWENDRAAYRLYGPALQRTGERSFGIDVWVKNTPELVVEERYKKDHEGNLLEDSLRKAGQKTGLDEINRSTSFHLDQGNGMDAYGVGPSLGCGTPALMKDGQLVFPYCYKTCRILDNGPLRFTAELTYNPTADGITEHRRISLDRGSHFNRMTVWYDGIRESTALASGVVLHGDEGLQLGKNYVQYADPTDRPDLHQSQIYVATLFPEGVSQTKLQKGELNHGIGVVTPYQGAPYTYYFGAAWSLYDIGSQAQWQLVIDEFLANLRQPFSYKVTE
jgi:hypothetical protein